MNRCSATLLLLTSALVAASTQLVPAKDTKPHPSDLPGVTPPEPIVKPMPVDAAAAPRNKGGWVRVGDWDVKISGAVTVDIGTSVRSEDR